MLPGFEDGHVRFPPCTVRDSLIYNRGGKIVSRTPLDHSNQHSPQAALRHHLTVDAIPLLVLTCFSTATNAGAAAEPAPLAPLPAPPPPVLIELRSLAAETLLPNGLGGDMEAGVVEDIDDGDDDAHDETDAVQDEEEDTLLFARFFSLFFCRLFCRRPSPASALLLLSLAQPSIRRRSKAADA